MLVFGTPRNTFFGVPSPPPPEQILYTPMNQLYAHEQNLMMFSSFLEHLTVAFKHISVKLSELGLMACALLIRDTPNNPWFLRLKIEIKLTFFLTAKKIIMFYSIRYIYGILRSVSSKFNSFQKPYTHFYQLIGLSQVLVTVHGSV